MVIQRISRSVQCRNPGQRQILHVLAQNMGDGTLHAVHTFTRIFRNNIARGIHDVSVVPRSARHNIGAGIAIEIIGAAVSRKDVVQRVACAVNIRRAGQDKVLDILSQDITNRTPDKVRSFVLIFGHDVRGIVNNIGIVSDTAQHGISARSPIEIVVTDPARQNVVCAVSLDGVVQIVAGSFDDCRTRQRQIFKITSQRIC